MDVARIGAATAMAALVGLASGCTGSLPSDQLEKSVKAKLTQQVGQAPDDVDCPDDLKAKVGATTRCTLTAGGQKIGATLKVTSVEGSNAQYSIQVDNKPQ